MLLEKIVRRSLPRSNGCWLIVLGAEVSQRTSNCEGHGEDSCATAGRRRFGC